MSFRIQNVSSDDDDEDATALKKVNCGFMCVFLGIGLYLLNIRVQDDTI